MKILYLMNVDWKWIKQRPHFIAEGLTKDNEVLLYYPFSYHRNKNVTCENATNLLKPKHYYCIPFRRKSAILEWVNNNWLKIFFSCIIKNYCPDLIWIAGNPDVAKYLSKNCLNKAVYDCMDDYYAMTGSEETIEKEERIVNNAKTILCSSETLRNVIASRYNVDKNSIALVRNGYDGKNISLSINRKGNSHYFSIAYIGTISSWFDFEKISAVIEAIDNVKFHIIGPIKENIKDIADRLKSDRIIFHGSVEHESLYELVNDVDCLIMPFVINDIILSVDPVKLYEYINFNKNIISVFYPEIDRFSKFVNFYNTKEELISVILELMNDNSLKYSADERSKFLRENTWESRLGVISELISE